MTSGQYHPARPPLHVKRSQQLRAALFIHLMQHAEVFHG
jgi:hypothetical protein